MSAFYQRMLVHRKKAEMGKKVSNIERQKAKTNLSMSAKKQIKKNGKRKVDKIAENIVAIDCEMVGVGKGRKSALARCSIVDYDGNVIFDKYVKPNGKITDYRTRYSGIMPNHMRNATTFTDAQSKVKEIISDKWIIGHSIDSDLGILQIKHKATRLRDTSKFISLRLIAGLPIFQTPSLRKLSKAILGLDIQSNSHCSVEDARAAMDLYRKVEDEWEQRVPEENTTKYFDDVFWPESLSMH
eukprot:gene4926-5573_t